MARVYAQFAALILAPWIAGQDRLDPRVEAVEALIEEYYDPLSTELEAEAAGERLVAIGPLAVALLAEAAVEDLRARHGWRGLSLLESLRAGAGPAVPALLGAAADDDVKVRHAALRTLGTIGPYVSGFSPGVVPEPESVPIEVGEESFDPVGAAWHRIATRCEFDRDAPVEELAAVFEGEEFEMPAIEMALEVLAERGAGARAALPALRELQQDVQQGYHLVGRRASGVSLALIGQVAGTVARIVPVEVGSLPDYERALGSNYVPLRDRLAVLQRLPALGADVVPLLVAVIRGSASRVVRLAAIRTLGRIGRPAVAALPDLEEVGSSSRDAYLSQAADQAAARIREP